MSDSKEVRVLKKGIEHRRRIYEGTEFDINCSSTSDPLCHEHMFPKAGDQAMCASCPVRKRPGGLMVCSGTPRKMLIDHVGQHYLDVTKCDTCKWLAFADMCMVQGILERVQRAEASAKKPPRHRPKK